MLCGHFLRPLTCIGSKPRLLSCATNSFSRLPQNVRRHYTHSATQLVYSSEDGTRSLRSRKPVTILGIESSCDDSCAAVVVGVPWPDPEDDSGPLRPPAGLEQQSEGSLDRVQGNDHFKAGPWHAEVLANVVVKQDHYVTRGVHPLVASKAHAVNVPRAVRAALAESQRAVNKMKRANIDRTSFSRDAHAAEQTESLDPNFGPNMIDAIAVTQGPGMPASLASGLVAAKTLAAVWDKPLIYVHHMAAHALVPFLVPRQDEIRTPFLAALVSGGHTLLVLVKGPEEFEVVGSTIDEAIGRVLDKAAVTLGLRWGPSAGPGGPSNAGAAVEQAAKLARPEDVNRLRQAGVRLPRGLSGPGWGYDMSFGGVKLSLEQQLRKLLHLPRSEPPSADVRDPQQEQEPEKAEAWASAQSTPKLEPATAGGTGTDHSLLEADPELTVAPTLELDEGPVRQVSKDTVRALAYLVQEAVVGQLARRIVEWLGGGKRRDKDTAGGRGREVQDVVLAGGVAANMYLRSALSSALDKGGRGDVQVHSAPAAWCTDNAAMIAHAGLATYARRTHDLARLAVPSWPLGQVRAPPEQPLARVMARKRRLHLTTDDAQPPPDAAG